MMVGTQYPVRLIVPPRHEPLPVFAMDPAVEAAFVPVLPKKVCRCDAPGMFGCTIGSSGSMWENLQTVRNAPVSSMSPLVIGISPVCLMLSKLYRLKPVGILLAAEGR